MMNNQRNLLDLNYRRFIRNLAREVTPQDMEELKYMLTSIIPAGIMESLDTPLKLLDHLGRNCLWDQIILEIYLSFFVKRKGFPT